MTEKTTTLGSIKTGTTIQKVLQNFRIVAIWT
ncbi:hypothetical protein J2Y60_003778 [Arcicella sp. BE140]|nr:hypothetical protein [Arcicella sp. BE51]MDR6813566.1 hypothetical protein [Arcicella sp. BE140]MDR6824878.1 hypothetical protein [Arcicella sp. BE139]